MLLSSAVGWKRSKKIKRANTSDLYPQPLNLENLKLIMRFNNQQFATEYSQTQRVGLISLTDFYASKRGKNQMTLKINEMDYPDGFK